MAILKDVLQGVRDTMDFTMLTDPVFVVYGLSCIFCMTGWFAYPHRQGERFLALNIANWFGNKLNASGNIFTKCVFSELHCSAARTIQNATIGLLENSASGSNPELPQHLLPFASGFFVPFIYLPDQVIQLGYDKTQGARLLSVLGITNTVGRVVAGWVSDRCVRVRCDAKESVF